MPIARVAVAAALLAGAALAGLSCQNQFNRKPAPASQPKTTIVPPGVAGTIGEYANLVGGDDLPVQGYGVVVGLGDNGSSEVPPNLQNYLVQLMLKHGLVAPHSGAAVLTPSQILRDKDTAIVVVEGRIPPGSPAGTKFDLMVKALPGTQTTSLDGGMLFDCELQMALTMSVADLNGARTWAAGRGPIFVNPFDNGSTTQDTSKLRLGRVPGGGTVTRARPINLELRQPDYRMATLIERAINQRFCGVENTYISEKDTLSPSGRRPMPEGQKVALARSPGLIELKVPEAYRDDYARFLRVLTHLYLMGGNGGDDRYAKQLGQAILQGGALYEDIALTWEGMGKQVLPIIRPLYTSTNPAAAYFAARAGLRLQDDLAIEPFMAMAQRSNSPYQIHAITELGNARWSVQALPLLKELLSAKSELVRLEAYEALSKHGPTSSVEHVKLSHDFTLDVVDSEGDFLIYATRTGQCKLVLFGRKIPLLKPVFYSPADEMVTISGNEKDDKIMVYRKIPRKVAGNSGISDPFYVAPSVHDMVKTLGLPARQGLDGNIEGLGLSYSQIVGILYNLHKGSYIPGDFVLQQSPEIQRMYLSSSSVGRPDTPAEEE